MNKRCHKFEKTFLVTKVSHYIGNFLFITQFLCSVPSLNLIFFVLWFVELETHNDTGKRMSLTESQGSQTLFFLLSFNYYYCFSI